jgi:hypothetical protein
MFILPENNTFDKRAKTKRKYHALPMCDTGQCGESSETKAIVQKT